MQSRSYWFVVVALVLSAQAFAASDSLDPREIIRRSIAMGVLNDDKAEQYTFRERREERRLGKNGEINSSSSETFDVILIGGDEFRRLTAKDDQPLSPKEERKQERKLEKSIREVQKETPRQREKRLAKREKRQAEERELREEIPEAFDFRLIGEERIGDMDTWVIEAEPRPDYEPQDRRTKFLSKVRGILWISKQDYGWVKADAETIQNVR